jgi:hypothetical protein
MLQEAVYHPSYESLDQGGCPGHSRRFMQPAFIYSIAWASTNFSTNRDQAVSCGSYETGMAFITGSITTFISVDNKEHSQECRSVRYSRVRQSDPELVYG